MLVLCVLAVAAVFVSSVFAVGIQLWNALLFTFGAVTAYYVVKVLFKICSISETGTKKLTMALRHQKRRNVNTLRSDATADDVRQVETTNARIDNVITGIDDAPLPSLFGVFALTKANVLKISGAIAAALFTTALRTVMPNLTTVK